MVYTKTSNIDFSQLKNSLLYLHVSELQICCERFSLTTKGKKIILITRILHFLKTGEKTETPRYPTHSIAKNQKENEPRSDALMLRGSYKNDLKNRLFFKDIIGPHFHFTAFGIDWLEQRWRAGNPPTYQEFAEMWIKEYKFRKEIGSSPKEEWAYINFVKRYMKESPKADRSEILNNWEAERNKHKDLINKIFRALL